MTLILAVLHFLSVWFAFIIISYAVSIHLNLGVVESFSAIKPPLSAVAFYLFFNKLTNRYDIIGILFIMVSIVLLIISDNYQSFSKFGKFN